MTPSGIEHKRDGGSTRWVVGVGSCRSLATEEPPIWVADEGCGSWVRWSFPLCWAPARPAVPVSNAPPGTNFGNLVRLRQATYGAAAYRPGETVQLTLEWEAMQAMDEAFKVFVHILGPNGLPVAQQDNEPLNGTYPTIRWQPGERVSDPYAIVLPADLPPGEYVVEVGLYRISDLTRLPVLDAGQNAVDDKLYIAPLVVQ